MFASDNDRKRATASLLIPAEEILAPVLAAALLVGLGFYVYARGDLSTGQSKTWLPSYISARQ